MRFLNGTLTGPVQCDADPTGDDSFIVSVVAVRLSDDQFVGKILTEMDDTPDFAPFRGVYSIR